MLKKITGFEWVSFLEKWETLGKPEIFTGISMDDWLGNRGLYYWGYWGLL